jgi:S-adenosylmethionine decarboxylase
VNNQSSPIVEQVAQQYLIRHVVVEANQCPFEALNDYTLIQQVLDEIADIVNTEIMARTGYHFQPYGVTAILVVGASHISAHTWPEFGYATVDLVVCREDFSLAAVINHVKKRLGAGSVNYLEFRRGLVE